MDNLKDYDRRFLGIFLVLTFFGVMNFLATISNPAFASIRLVYVMRLVSVGMCFGGAIIALVAYFHLRSHGKMD